MNRENPVYDKPFVTKEPGNKLRMLPMIQRYYESDDGKRELAAWKQKYEEETYANQ